MKQIFNITGRIKAYLEREKERSDEARRKRLILEAQERIQVREYMSELHICIDNLPIAKADDFKKPFNVVLTDMRALYTITQSKK